MRLASLYQKDGIKTELKTKGVCAPLFLFPAQVNLSVLISFLQTNHSKQTDRDNNISAGSSC